MIRRYCSSCGEPFSAASEASISCPICRGTTSLSDRRDAEREMRETELILRQENLQLVAETQDISGTGIGIRFPGTPDLKIGLIVEAALPDLKITRSARVVWSRSDAEWGTAGLEWMPATRDDETSSSH